METLEATLSDYELERGKPMPSLNHGIVQANLAAELRMRLRNTHTLASELNLEFDGVKFVPDLAVLPKLETNLQEDTIWVKTAPLTTIEILSPMQAMEPLLEKAKGYFAVGVKTCWLVIPALGTIAVFTGPTTYRAFTNTNGNKVIDEVLGVEIPLNDIFS